MRLWSGNGSGGRRRKTPLTLIIADIDHFKAYNDAYGHVIGDDCLKKVAAGLDRSILRDVDTIARYGGEEFAAILPETDQEGGSLIAKRMLKTIQGLNIPHEQSSTANRVTISLGLATIIPNDETNATRLIQAADRALYLAKASGRNTFKTD